MWLGFGRLLARTLTELACRPEKAGRSVPRPALHKSFSMLSNPIVSQNPPHIVVTTSDFERLQRVLSSHDGAGVDRLDIELARAEVVDPHEVPSDVVTMNSEVVSEDLATGVKRTVRIVYPEDADAQQGRVSVLAPLGSALLGLGVGQEIEWRMPQGIRRLRVVAVPYQPEASGHFDL